VDVTGTEIGREDTFDHGHGIGIEIGRERKNLFVQRRVWRLFLPVNGRDTRLLGNREVAVAVAVGEGVEEEVQGGGPRCLLNFVVVVRE
jgi:hypothetical protein